MLIPVPVLTIGDDDFPGLNRISSAPTGTRMNLFLSILNILHICSMCVEVSRMILSAHLNNVLSTNRIHFAMNDPGGINCLSLTIVSYKENSRLMNTGLFLRKKFRNLN